jgi:hypothetical protein
MYIVWWYSGGVFPRHGFEGFRQTCPDPFKIFNRLGYINISNQQLTIHWKHGLLQPVCFPYPPFHQIPIHRLLEIPGGNGDQHLVAGVMGIGMGKVNNPEGIKMKRGTFLKKFLYPFFPAKPFVPAKRELPHETKFIIPVRARMARGLAML